MNNKQVRRRREKAKPDPIVLHIDKVGDRYGKRVSEMVSHPIQCPNCHAFVESLSDPLKVQSTVSKSIKQQMTILGKKVDEKWNGLGSRINRLDEQLKKAEEQRKELIQHRSILVDQLAQLEPMVPAYTKILKLIDVTLNNYKAATIAKEPIDKVLTILADSMDQIRNEIIGIFNEEEASAT